MPQTRPPTILPLSVLTIALAGILSAGPASGEIRTVECESGCDYNWNARWSEPEDPVPTLTVRLDTDLVRSDPQDGDDVFLVDLSDWDNDSEVRVTLDCQGQALEWNGESSNEPRVVLRWIGPAGGGNPDSK